MTGVHKPISTLGWGRHVCKDGSTQQWRFYAVVLNHRSHEKVVAVSIVNRPRKIWTIKSYIIKDPTRTCKKVIAKVSKHFPQVLVK